MRGQKTEAKRSVAQRCPAKRHAQKQTKGAEAKRRFLFSHARRNESSAQPSARTTSTHMIANSSMRPTCERNFESANRLSSPLQGLDSAGTDRRSFVRRFQAAAIHRGKVDRLSIRELNDLLSVPEFVISPYAGEKRTRDVGFHRSIRRFSTKWTTKRRKTAKERKIARRHQPRGTLLRV